MFRKLQFKFMWVSTLVLLLVICVVVGAVYWITMSSIMSQTGVLMELILDNDGELPERSAFNARQARFLALNNESLYEARFFSVEEVDGVLTLVTRHIAALSEEDALALAETALDLSGDIGRITVAGDRKFHYLRRDEDDGSTMIVVLDATSRYGLIHLIMTYMAALWLAVLLLYVVIMGRFSGRVVRPFIENDENAPTWMQALHTDC